MEAYQFGPYRVEFELPYGPDYAPFQACQADAGFDLRLRIPTGMALTTEQVYKELVQPFMEGAYVDGVPHSLRDRAHAHQVADALPEAEWLRLEPQATVLVGTGVKWRVSGGVPGKTLVLLLVPRSGLGVRTRLRLANTVGVVDAQYRDEIMLGLENGGTYPHYLQARSRVAQGIITEVFCLGKGGASRQGGLGHSGVA